MLIGEAPGREEEQCGRPFVGKSGRELTRILDRVGLPRDGMYVTNVCKLRPPYINGKQQPPSKEDIERDEQELIEELLRVRPRWVGALGRVATRWLCGDQLDMESSWSLAYPFNGRVADRLRTLGAGAWVDECRVVPLYHPAAGLHNTDLSAYVWRGIEIFSEYVHERLPATVPVDLFPTPSYTDDLSEARRMRGGVVACDTEGLPGRVWGGSLSSEPGRAWVGRVSDAQERGRVVEEFQRVLDDAERVVFHNALHDVPILDEMGVHVDWARTEDTFLMAYVLRLVPMGLKQLSRRFSGMEMRAYLEVVAPAEHRIAREWVARALAVRECPLCEGTGKVRETRKDGKGLKKQPVRCWWGGCVDGGMWPVREPQLKYDWDTGQWTMTNGWSVGRYLRGLRKDLEAGKYDVAEDGAGEDEETEAEQPSVRRRIQGWPDDVVAAIEMEVGELEEPTLDDIPLDDAVWYSARDADATVRAYPVLREQVERLELTDAYRLDLSVIPVAAEMQRNGMYVDQDYFRGFVAELERDNQIILARIQSRVGRPLNPGSGDQVAGLLFGDRRLEFSKKDEFTYETQFDLTPEKYTRSGKRASVNDKVLEGLKLKHSTDTELVELIDLILDYRARDKILGTYARKLPLIADSNSRVHTTIKPCRTATFRWASASPNLQNIPTRQKGNVDLGKLVRRGFVAPPGRVLGSWDFDQIEMRVLAWYSQDENLLRVFREGIDIHSMTAALVFRVPLDQFVSELNGSDPALAHKRKDQRTSAKNIGFGIVYGVTAEGLRAQMELRGQHWTTEECQSLIDMYLYEAYPGIGRFMMDAHAEARREGYVRSLFGHIRYLPGVHSSISSVREEALRQAANSKIQITAAELLKVSMRALRVEYRDVLREVDALILMAVHDELLFELPDTVEARAVVDTVVTAAMTNPVMLDGVRVGTEGKFAYSWDELK
jgi:uracil-DNA glycosylase family 4